MGGWAAFLLFFLRANYAHIFALRTISAARGESAAAVGGAAALCTPFRRRSRSARFAAGAPPYSAAFLPIRRFHFRAYVPAAIKLFRVQAVGSFSGVYSQKYFNRISKNARLWAYAADVENLSFQQYPYFFQ